MSDDNTPVHADVVAWVEEWLVANVERRVDRLGTGRGALWCPRWWDHPEAHGRLEALWREWETAFVTDTLAAWWLEFDLHWNVLTDEDGPFGDCRPESHVQYGPLEVAPVDGEGPSASGKTRDGPAS
jgi:hypothetical protein